jgi:hypothetical protein
VDDIQQAWDYRGFMLDFARQHGMEALKESRKAILASGGPAGVQAGEFACEAAGPDLFLLVPWTSDHLFNLEHESSVTVLTPGWELNGTAQIVSDRATVPGLALLKESNAEFCALVRVHPRRIQIRRAGGWGSKETIDLEP